MLCAILFVTLQKNIFYMVQLRIKECLKEHGMQQKDLANKLGIQPISLSQMLARKKFGIDKLEEIASIIGCKVSELFEEDKTSDFAAYVRCKGIHFYADNIDEFDKMVEEVKTIAR